MEEGTLYNSATIDLAIVSKINRKSKLARRSISFSKTVTLKEEETKLHEKKEYKIPRDN